MTEAPYKALTFDQAGKKRKLDTDAETSKVSPVTKPKNSLKPTTKKSTTEKKLYRTGEWYLGTDEEPYDNNGKCLTEGGLFAYYQCDTGKRAKKPEATRVTIMRREEKPGPKPKDTDKTGNQQQADPDTTQEAMEDEP